MTEPGLTYGTMTPVPLSRSRSVAPDNLTLPNASAPSPWTTGNGDDYLTTHSNQLRTSLDVYNDSDLPPLNSNMNNACATPPTALDAPAPYATTSIGTNDDVKAIEATLRSFPKTLILEKQSLKSQKIIPLPILGMPVEYFHTTDFELEGERRMRRQLFIGFMDPRVPAKAVRLMNSRMIQNKENVDITSPPNTSGGTDTMEFPM